MKKKIVWAAIAVGIVAAVFLILGTRKLSEGRRCQSPERSGAGGARKRARHGFGVCAAQSCTSGIDRRSRPELETSP